MKTQQTTQTLNYPPGSCPCNNCPGRTDSGPVSVAGRIYESEQAAMHDWPGAHLPKR